MLRRNPFAALGVKQLHSDSLRKTTSGLQSALKAELVAGEGEETTKARPTHPRPSRPLPGYAHCRTFQLGSWVRPMINWYSPSARIVGAALLMYGSVSLLREYVKNLQT